MKLPFDITLEEYLNYQKFTFDGFYIEQTTRAGFISQVCPDKFHIEPLPFDNNHVNLWRLNDWTIHYRRVCEQRESDLANRKVIYSFEIRRETLEKAICSKMGIDISNRGVPLQIATLCQALSHLDNDALLPVLATYGIDANSFQGQLSREQALLDAKKELALPREITHPDVLQDSPNMAKVLAEKKQRERSE